MDTETIHLYIKVLGWEITGFLSHCITITLAMLYIFDKPSKKRDFKNREDTILECLKVVEDLDSYRNVPGLNQDTRRMSGDTFKQNAILALQSLLFSEKEGA